MGLGKIFFRKHNALDASAASTKRLKYCDHEWFLEYKVRNYLDYSGNSVEVWRCICTKCGVVEDRKYIKGCGLM